MIDKQQRFHEEWLGLAQPIEGLVFSIPVLADAQIVPDSGPALSTRFRRWIDGTPPSIADLVPFFREFLGYSSEGMLVARADLPAELHFYAEEGRQDIRPSFAIADDDLFADLETNTDSGRFVALVWDVRDDAGYDHVGLSLDKPEEVTGTWRYPPTAKFERLLRHTGIAVGLICNGRDLRLVYAPARESTSHLTFRFADMAEPAGRPLLAAFELLLNARRTYQAAPEHTIVGLLAESRKRQADVTEDLAAQVFEAVEILLEGFEQAALRETDEGRIDWLEQALREEHDHLYQGVLSVVLRLVFLLYAEDQGLLPVGHPLYAKHLSIAGLYDDLVDDAGMHPESMHHRFGAYGRLLALFRGVYLGVKHGALVLPPRRGRLFDPSSFPFLEGGLPGSTSAIVDPEARADVRPPAVDDGVIHAVLSRLILFQGQRLSYGALDVEQIGSVYESLMGYHVVRVTSPAVRLGGNRVWVEVDPMCEMKPTDRKKWLKEQVGLSTAQQAKVDAALKAGTTPGSAELHSAKENDGLIEALIEMAPGGKAARDRHRAPAGKLVLQPGEERRRSGSHYTPRSLTERIVRRTLEPILKCLGDTPSEDLLLSLKICDPAMGSGAFLVEVCRQLSDQLVSTWTREGRAEAIAEQHGDPHLHARRLVAQRCLYGVDKNPAAVELAKLSLWLVTMSAELPFTFVDHALRHGDSLVGFDLEQTAAFHWQPKKGDQLELFDAGLKDALEQAIAYRQEIVELADREDPGSQEEKRRLLDHALHATAKVRLAADVCIGAFFKEAKDKARETERKRRMLMVRNWFEGDDSVEPELREMADEIRERHAPFHWWLEFPEVFYQERPDPLAGGKVNGAAYMEAFVGNPPFAGKNTITDSNGPGYVEWLQTVHEGAHGNADLSAHFFRRVATLIGKHGSFGLVATNTIAQGDTRATGLKALIDGGWKLYDATNSMAWPGAAAVTVSIVHGAKGEAKNIECILDAVVAPAINSLLKAKPERSVAQPIRANTGSAFVGSYVLGMGFTLTPEERDALVAGNSKNAERVFPYLGGQEVNTSPTQTFDRYVISFGDMALDEAERWPDLIAIVREKVKPERDKNNRANYRDNWWLYGEYRPGMLQAIAPLERCLVTARVTKHLCFSFQPTDRVFSEAMYVFPLDSHTPFAVLQSRVHEPWARLLSSSMKTDLRYAASDCFDTFPFPQPDPRTVIPSLEAAGKALYDARAAFMIQTDQGLTKTYNALKNPSVDDPAVFQLRNLHEAMDRAVLDAYGWSDIVVPPFCPANEEQKAALAAFEDEVIDRLYVLNAERAAEEQKQKPNAKTQRRKGAKKS